MTELRIVCFGEFQVTLAGTALTAIPTDKTRALLAYLAIESKPHQRNELAQFLWPGYSEESARHSLRQSLFRLRQLLQDTVPEGYPDPPWLLQTRQTVQLNPAASVSVDVTTFTQLLAEWKAHVHADLATCSICLARLRQAVDLYQGDFLTGFSVVDSDRFEEWRRILQEQLHIQLLDALTQLANAAERAGDQEGALQTAQRQLALEPWWEAAHRQVMRILAQRGQHAAAIAQFERCRQVLAKEFQGEPDAETQAMYEQIQRGDFGKERKRGGGEAAALRDRGGEQSAFSPPRSSPSTSLLHDWGEMPAVDLFHGRSQERAELVRWLRQVGIPSLLGPRLILIHGIGGVGKTTLAASVTREIAAEFDFFIWRSLLNAPPLVEILHDWLQLLGRQGSPADLPDKQDDQIRLLLGYLRQQRGLLILDNLESILQAGAGSPLGAGAPRPGYEAYAQLIQQIGSSNHQSCLLLTSREQPQVLARLLGHTPAIRLLPLAGLDAAAGHEMLQIHGLSASVAESTSLVDLYSGNPLALQLVASTIRDLFGGDVGAFQQEGALAFDSIRQVLDEQFARLSKLEREILLWLAVEREVVTVPMLRNNLVKPGAPRLLVEALQDLQKRSLLERSDEGFTLQNVVMEYATELLVDQVCREIAHFGGIEAWEREETSGASRLLPLATLLAESFFNHHALLKAQAKEAVRHSQLRTIVQPIAERLVSRLDRQGVETVLQRVLVALHAQVSAPLPAAGYAGGNLLNLLLALGVDVTGYDFSQLSVWQADLRGVYVPRLNFSDANLTGAAFTSSFGNLLAFQFDANNQLLVAELQEEHLRICRVADRSILNEWRTHGLNLQSLFWSPDCQLLAGMASGHVIHLFDCTAGCLLFTLAGHHSPIWRVCFSPAGVQSSWGSMLASGDASGHICLWDCQSGQLVQSLSLPVGVTTTHVSITALAIAPDGQRLASATVEGVIYLWSIAEGTLIHSWRGHAEEVATLEFALDGSRLASGSHDATVRLWEVSSGRLLHVLQGHSRSIRALATTPAGRILASGGGDPFVYLWDLERGTALHILSSHASAVERLVISPNGKWIATVDLNAIVSLWDTRRGQRVDFYPIYRNTHTSLDFAPDGQRLISGGYDGALYLWDIHSLSEARVIARLHGHRQRVMTVAFHPDGQTIASGAIDCDIHLWDSHSARRAQRAPLTLSGHSASIICLSFNPVGTILASSSDDSTVTLWSVATPIAGGTLYPQRLRVLRGHTNGLKCCCFSPLPTDPGRAQPQLLASGGLDNMLRLWDVESGALRYTLAGHTNSVTDCLFSADGRHLLSAGYDQTLRLWDTSSGQLLATWPTANAVYLTLALHPNGSLVAAGGDDNLIRLLEFETGRVLNELAGHSRHVTCVRFSPSGQILASTSGDDTIKLWDVCALDEDAARNRCLQTLQSPGPYTGMDITGVTSISEAQKAALRTLGAVEE